MKPIQEVKPAWLRRLCIIGTVGVTFPAVMLFGVCMECGLILVRAARTMALDAKDIADSLRECSRDVWRTAKDAW